MKATSGETEPNLPFSGERVIEGATPARIWADHVARYEFACSFVKGKTVLDIACGTGYGSRILRDKGKAQQVVGLDISEDAVNYAVSKYKTSGLDFGTADVLNIGFGQDYFDVAVCFETIEHVKDPKKVIFELLRVLKPNGMLIISSPNRTVTSPGKSLTDSPQNPYHLTEFSQKEFISLLREHSDVVGVYGQREKSRFFFFPILVKALKHFFPSLYDPSRGSPKLRKLRWANEYRYITAICMKRANS
jgi:ubiquinone/menaquinone biosynthesis C-methylase UbiE